MRRTAALLALAIGTGVLPHAAAAQQPGVIHTVFEIADASWFVREHGRPFMYVGGGYRSTDPLGRTRTMAFADKIKCWEKKTKNFGLTICFGAVRATKIPSEDLQFDPLLNETTVSFGRNRISWKGRGDYSPDAFPFADPNFGALAYASVDREARARGKLLGLNLQSRGWKDWGYLSEGFFGGVINRKSGRVTYEDDGTITYRIRFRRPL
ncbi:MAG: hypothetical protein ACRDLB_11905 [Actinomycetota bacterium]